HLAQRPRGTHPDNRSPRRHVPAGEAGAVGERERLGPGHAHRGREHGPRAPPHPEREEMLPVEIGRVEPAHEHAETSDRCQARGVVGAHLQSADRRGHGFGEGGRARAGRDGHEPGRLPAPRLRCGGQHEQGGEPGEVSYATSHEHPSVVSPPSTRREPAVTSRWNDVSRPLERPSAGPQAPRPANVRRSAVRAPNGYGECTVGSALRPGRTRRDYCPISFRGDRLRPRAADAPKTTREEEPMTERNIRRELEKKREELREKGKPEQIGRPYETSRELVEEGERKRTGTNLDIGEERSEEQLREMREARESRSE